jgi:hypothetical protein
MVAGMGNDPINLGYESKQHTYVHPRITNTKNN